MPDHPYDLIIGLEVHVQLLTETKLFCGCSTKFGAAPNTQTCPVCIGMPGTLPVMNREAFRLALKTAVALNCEIPEFTKWDRKQYYYPDLPKGYQISQYDLPMSQKGWLEISDPKGRFAAEEGRHHPGPSGRRRRQEPARRSGRQGRQADRPQPHRHAAVGNRHGARHAQPAEETRAYLTELKLLLTYLGVSDCNMQEGSLRVDANVNLHIDTPQGKDRHADRRDQEPQQLPRRRAGAGLRSRAAVRSLAGNGPQTRRSRRPSKPAAGTTPRASRAASARRKNRATTAIFPIPTCAPSSRRPPRSKKSAAAWPSCPPRFASGWKRATASRPTTAT